MLQVAMREPETSQVAEKRHKASFQVGKPTGAAQVGFDRTVERAPVEPRHLRNRKPALLHAHAKRNVADGDERATAYRRERLADGGIAFGAVRGIAVEASNRPSPTALAQLVGQGEVARGHARQAQARGRYGGDAQVGVSEGG